MARQATAADRVPSGSNTVPAYARHRPEQTLLYQIIEQHYPAFLAQRAAEERSLPRYVQREGEQAYLTLESREAGSSEAASGIATPAACGGRSAGVSKAACRCVCSCSRLRR